MPMTLQEFQRKGGKARMKSLTKAERTKLAKRAAAARWRNGAGNSQQRRVARRAAKRK